MRLGLVCREGVMVGEERSKDMCREEVRVVIGRGWG